MKARLSTMLCLLMIASIVSIPPSSVAETGGILVESDMTWSNDMAITENVRVVNGGSLTLSNADFSVSDGVELSLIHI